MNDYWFYLDINPEPWAIGTIAYRHMTPNVNLKTYQEAVKEILEDAEMLPKTYCRLEFYFWRQIEKYIDQSDHIKTRNQVDATNLQKGLEDALQGILFENDRDVRDIRSVIVEQNKDVVPRVLIRASEFSLDLSAVPEKYLEPPVQAKQSSNKWTGGDLF